MREVTAATFGEEVLASAIPVVVDFWAPWCGPCELVAPILERLGEEHAGRVAFVRLNVDEHPEVAARYDVLTLPTTIVFAEGAARETVVGAGRRASYERALADY